MKEKKKVFISCVEEDRLFIEGLHRDLENYGFETFWYAEDSPAGVSFKNHTAKEIDSCDHFLACFSEASTNKGQSDMRRELTIACEIHKTLQPDTNWLYCLRFFRPLPKGRLCYNTISLKGVSNGETKNLHSRV